MRLFQEGFRFPRVCAILAGFWYIIPGCPKQSSGCCICCPMHTTLFTGSAPQHLSPFPPKGSEAKSRKPKAPNLKPLT